MNIESGTKVMIFKNYKNNEEDDVFYSINLPQKNIDGEWEYGTIPCNFNRSLNLDNIHHKDKIILLNAWVKFYKKATGVIGKNGNEIINTIPLIFINNFELCELDENFEKVERKNNTQQNTHYNNESISKDISNDNRFTNETELTDDDMENLENLPFYS